MPGLVLGTGLDIDAATDGRDRPDDDEWRKTQPDLLDISPLVNAVERLREGLERHRREPDDDQLRDGLIQRFEFTSAIGYCAVTCGRSRPRRTLSAKCRFRT